MAAVTLHKLKGAEEVIIYQTICLNDYVQLCHINAFYYGNMYIYYQMPKKRVNEWEGQRPRLHSCSLKWKVLQTGKSRANKHWLYRPDVSTLEVFFSFFFLKYIYFIFFWSVQHNLRYSSHPRHTDPAWTDLSYSELVGSERRGSYTGAAKPGALNCLKLSNHNLAPWAAGPSLQARASLQTYRVAF